MADVIESDLTPNYSGSGNYFGSSVGYPFGTAPPAGNFDANVITTRKITTVLPNAVEAKYTNRFMPQEG